MNDDYLGRFLGTEDDSTSEREAIFPDWVSEGNSSRACYEALLKLYEQKKRYIRTHNKKTAYTKKSTYQISQSEIAREASKVVRGPGEPLLKPQPLFNSVNYAAGLNAEFEAKNKLLQMSKDKAISKRYTGNQAKPKDEVVDLLTKSQAEVRRLEALIVSDVYELGLQRMSLDVKTKLKLL